MFDLTDKSNQELTERTFDKIADALVNTGYIVLPHALNHRVVLDLQQRIQSIPSDCWLPAGIGRNQKYQRNAEIRTDKIAWISEHNKIESVFLACMEKLRQAINRRLFLGLFDYECHFAIFSKESFYQKHLDSLKGKSNRIVSTVLYLNSHWWPADAGELLIYSLQTNKPVQSVLPHLGTLAILLSEQIPHQVIKANRQRYSIAGWFRVNPSQSGSVDPADQVLVR